LAGDCASNYTQLLGSTQCKVLSDAECSADAAGFIPTLLLACAVYTVYFALTAPGSSGVVTATVLFFQQAQIVLANRSAKSALKSTLLSLMGLQFSATGSVSGMCLTPRLSTLGSLALGYAQPAVLAAVFAVIAGSRTGFVRAFQSRSGEGSAIARTHA
jgi:hypothetical protein